MKTLTRDEFSSLIQGKIVTAEPISGSLLRITNDNAMTWFSETQDLDHAGYVGTCNRYVFIGTKPERWSETFKVGGAE